MNDNLASLSDRQLAKIIADNFDRIPERDQPFAESLRFGVDRYGSATPKQRPHLERMAAKALGAGEPQRVKSAVGDLSGVTALFDKARQHLKAPAVVIGMDGQEIRLSVAGDNARVPGSINVARNGGDEWFGRILKDGQFEASPRIPTPPGLVAGLQRFAADPAGVAAEHGRLTGKCCFCNRGLKDERSTAVGYGPQCADRFGLPWGTKAEAA